MIPTWALSVFGVVFLLVFSVATWGIKLAINRVHSDLGKIDKKVDEVKSKVEGINERVVRVETIVNGNSGRAVSASVASPV